MILLDTHVLLWVAEDQPRLGQYAREVVDSAAAERSIVVSAISFWELGMLLSKGRLGLAIPLADFAAAVSGNPGYKVAPVNSQIAVETANLPTSIHRDPGDRFLIATARRLACPMLTADEKILVYAAEGHVQAIDARL